MVKALVLPEENSAPRLSIQDIIPVELVTVNYPALISIRVSLAANGSEKADRLRKLIDTKPGSTDVRLRLEKPRDFSVILDLSIKVKPDKEFLQEVERICGTEAIEVLAG
jgi:DNA polymerase III subunit alpha